VTQPWITILASALSAVIAGAVAAGVATFQVRSGLANATRLALEAFQREQRRDREKQEEEATLALGGLVHDMHMSLTLLAGSVELLHNGISETDSDAELIEHCLSASSRLKGQLAACHREVWTRQAVIGPQVTQAFYRLLECYEQLVPELQQLQSEAQAESNISDSKHLIGSALQRIEEMSECSYRMIAPPSPASGGSAMTMEDRDMSAKFARQTQIE
jgi:hypothetical protein